MNPGAPGIILVPGWDDGKLYWEKGILGQIENKNMPIQNLYFGYTMIMDIFIQNPLQFSRHPRVIFSRGAIEKKPPSGDTLLGVLDNYNLAVALLPDTTDMLVSVLNKNNQMENVYIPNIPVQDVFRLGIVVMERTLEVYINGHLMKTRSFTAGLKDVKGDIYPASGIEKNIAKIRNLKIWSRILTTSEIRYAKPQMSTKEDMGGDDMPSTTLCPTQISSENIEKKLFENKPPLIISRLR